MSFILTWEIWAIVVIGMVAAVIGSVVLERFERD